MSAETLPLPVRVVNAGGRSPYVLTCEHASRFIPARYNGLGLPEAERIRHIAWDIGALDMALKMSAVLDAPVAIAGYSRLIIDLNRPPGSSTSIPEVSEATVIPGNLNLSGEDRETRAAAYFHPFDSAVRGLLDRREAERRRTILLGVHSFTPVYKGLRRPWRAGILFRRSEAFGKAFAAALGGMEQAVAENQPYRIEDDHDYTVPVHGEARGLDAVLIEVRQDLIAEPAAAAEWGERLAKAASSLL
jgi:predicted N-formylglutamate amidohydrolase